MIFEKWMPNTTVDITERLYLEALHDDHEGFRLFLRGSENNSKTLKVSFSHSLCYRNTDESNLIKTLYQQNFDGWPFFTVKNSNFLKWFLEESCGTLDTKDLMHYAVYTPNDCIDILSVETPCIEWL